MVGAWSQKLVRIWKRTSVHHQPSRIALALALGIAVGLVPKTSAIGILMCAALITLPIHNLTAVLVCAGVSLLAGKLDPLTHHLGMLLLESPTLFRFWQSIETTPLLPWLGLQNSVTTGSVVLGCLLIGPCYAVAFRVVDRLFLTVDEQEHVPVPIRIVHSAHDVSAGPHFRPRHRTQPAETDNRTSSAESDPASEPQSASNGSPAFTVSTAPINDWHISLARDRSRAVHLIGAPQSESETLGAESARLMTSAEIVSDGYRTLPGRRVGDEERSSIDVMREATDMLAWVDEAIEDCLALDRQIQHSDLSNESYEMPVRSHADDNSPERARDAAEEQWLMETTIEIVRWAESVDVSRIAEPFHCEVVTPSNEFVSDHAYCVPMHSPVDTSGNRTENPSAGSVEQVGASVLNLIENIETMQTAAVAPVPSNNTLVMTAGPSERKSTNEESSTVQDRQRPLVVSAQRGETLSYLIQHLRETRDGNGQ